MSATTRSTARLLAAVAALPVALTLLAVPASARPDAGVPTTDRSAVVLWGSSSGDGPAYPGQRFGVGLPPEQRGNVLEFLHR